MIRTLLLNGENVQTVCFSKGLKRLGCRVEALCSSKLSSGYVTRYLDKRYISPEIDNSQAFDDYFWEHLTAHEYDLIIPMGDESANFLSKNKALIEQTYSTKVAICGYDVFNLANDKSALMEICARHGISHPRNMVVDMRNLDNAAEYVGFPAMIKPNISAGAKGITRVESIDELRDKLPSILSEYGECSLQQYVEQPSYYYNVMLYRNSKGEIVGHTVIKICRYFPLKGGSSCYCETVEDPLLVNECKRVLDILCWEGFADFDVLIDKNTGEYKIIEINPRVPSSLQASYAAGIDFSEIYLNDILHKPQNSYHYNKGQQVRWFGLDVMWFVMSHERFSFKPSWFRFFGRNVSYHDGSWSDPMPMVVGCLSGIKKYLNPSFRKAKLKG